MEDKWYHDIQAGELINLKNCKSVWIHADREKTEDYGLAFSLRFAYFKGKDVYLHYETSKLLHNAFSHYRELLKCKELDVSVAPLTL
jgi:hypothetical protein